MNSLGDAFPEDLKASFIDDNVRPGTILYRWTVFPETSKYKYVIVLTLRPDILVCFINSQVAPFIQSRPKLQQSIVKLNATDYPFLDHDSYAHCLEINRDLTHTALDADLRESLECIKGRLSKVDLLRIRDAIQKSPRIPARYKQSIIQSLDTEISLL